MKTIKEWINEWGDTTFKKAALKYCEDEGSLDKEAVSLSWALTHGFDWRTTVEGEEFWQMVVRDFHKQNL